MTEDLKPTPRKRRTPEELRAFYDQKLKEISDGEKREVIRLLSGALDDLSKASTYKCSPASEVAAASKAAKEALAKLEYLNH